MSLEWTATGGGQTSIAGAIQLHIIISTGWSSELDRLRARQALESAGLLQVNPLVQQSYSLTAIDWQVIPRRLIARLFIRFDGLNSIQFHVIFDLTDPDWRRMLKRLHRDQTEQGAVPYVVIHSSDEEYTRWTQSIEDGQQATLSSLGLWLGPVDCEPLATIADLEPGMSHEEFYGVTTGLDPAVISLRNTIPQLVDIEPHRGGPIAVIAGDAALLAIDLGYGDDADQGWVEAAFEPLLQREFTRVSTLENPWPGSRKWYYVLLDAQIVVLYAPLNDRAAWRYLYAGPFNPPFEWRRLAEQRSGIVVMVANLNVLTNVPDDGDKIEQTVELVLGAVELQQAVGATILGLTDEDDAIRDVLMALDT